MSDLPPSRNVVPGNGIYGPACIDDCRVLFEDTYVDIDAAELLVNDFDNTSMTVVGFYASGWYASTLGTVQWHEGKLRYTPPANYFGGDSFAYRVEDSHSPPSTGIGHVWLDVRPVNDLPQGTDDVAYAASGGPPVGLWLLAGDSDLENPWGLRLIEVTQPTHGFVWFNELDATYIPDPTYTGDPLHFTYTLCDAEGGAATANVTMGYVNLTIYDGQFGQEVEERLETTRGAFTVANLNDTDGDGDIDRDDPDGVVAAKMDPKRGEDEVDLIRLVLHKPTPDLGGTVRLWVHPAAAVRLWEESTKITAIPINPQGGFGYGYVDFPVSDLDKTVWVELVAPSTHVRDYSLSMEYRGISDTVNATAVWASLTSSEFATLDAPDVFNEYPDIDPLTKNSVQETGGTGIRPFDWGTLHNAGVMQFTVMPPEIEDEVNAPLVNFDVARRVEDARWYWKDGELVLGPALGETLPVFKDEANDDPHELDETLWPTQSQHMYSMDSPGLPWQFWPSEERPFDHIRFVVNSWEYVRVGIGTDPLGNTLMGSRASDFYEWGSMTTLGADGSVPEGFQRVYDDFYGTNYIGLDYFFPLE